MAAAIRPENGCGKGRGNSDRDGLGGARPRARTRVKGSVSVGMSLTISVAAPFTAAGAALPSGRCYLIRIPAFSSKCSGLSDLGRELPRPRRPHTPNFQSGGQTSPTASGISRARGCSRHDRSHRDGVQCGDRRPDPAGRAGRPDRVHGRDGRNPRTEVESRATTGGSLMWLSECSSKGLALRRSRRPRVSPDRPSFASETIATMPIEHYRLGEFDHRLLTQEFKVARDFSAMTLVQGQMAYAACRTGSIPTGRCSHHRWAMTLQ